MKTLRTIIALSLCLNLCLNANNPTPEIYNIGTQSTNQYSIPTSLIKDVIKLLSADLDAKGPGILAQAEKFGKQFRTDCIADGKGMIAQFSSNAGIMIAGLLVGSVGAYITTSSINRAIDKSLDIDKESNDDDKVTYAKLFAKGALGLAIITGTGFAVNALLK